MKVSATLRTAVRNIKRAPIRSSLSSIGVLVGVAAVVTTTSVGMGAKEKIQQTLSRPEARTIELSAIAPRAEASLLSTDGLRVEDYYAIRNAQGLSVTTVRMYPPKARAQLGTHNIDITLEGIDVGGFAIEGRALLQGHLFGELDVDRAAAVCVISRSLATALYAGDADRRIGERIRLNGYQFLVIGVVEDSLPSSFPSRNARDLHVYVPYTTVLRRLDRKSQFNIAVQTADIEYVHSLQRIIDDLMEQRRGKRTAEFHTGNSFDFIRTYADSSLIVARLIGVVGAISLVVGGIGIMNIMLASVMERTREIGIRLAVGTRKQHIAMQFFSEAIVISMIGGLGGIFVGCTTSWLITRINRWPTEVRIDSIAYAVLLSILVGIFFGYHPARQAASLDPIRALRSEN